MALSEVLFNFNDVILLMTAMQCFFFAVLLVATNTRKSPSTYFLAAFLFAHAFIPLHELTLWGAVFKWKMRELNPNLFFIGGSAYFLDGALLYFCVKSLVFRDFTLRKRDALHLIPVALFLIYLFATFYRLPLEMRIQLIKEEEFVYGWHYVTVEFLAKSLRVVYCLLCLNLLINYKGLLKATHSNIEKVDLTWLTTLVVGFLVIMSSEVVLSIVKLISLVENYDLKVFEYIGLTGYYSLFFLVNLLVFTGIRYFASFEAVRQKETNKKPLNDRLLNPECAEHIDKTMRAEKPYLMPDITLDMLAEKLDIPAKDLSMMINRHFGVHFYEFINRYRIEEATHLLADPENKDKTITDIYLEVGFNSKSVFNTFFKKIVGVTPSQYRQNTAQQAAPLA
jgi:AraC-like DNA-binding protein